MLSCLIFLNPLVSMDHYCNGSNVSYHKERKKVYIGNDESDGLDVFS